MIVDLRTYTMFPGRLGAWLKLYESDGYAIHVRHLGKPMGIFTTDVGTLNQVVFFWRYESQADREKRREALKPTRIGFPIEEERRSRERPASREQDHQVDRVPDDCERRLQALRICSTIARKLATLSAPA